MEEDFDLDIAIEDKGSCLRQNTSCTNCFLGKLLYQHGHKAHLEDLCEHDLERFLNCWQKIQQRDTKK